MKFPILESALTQHVAFLGKTGSGKTSTAKLMVEHVVAQNARVCVLDPIKSDWWGITSSADGKHAGLPFQILGGPRAHVPLHADAGAAIGELVASGSLPWSIIDMADFKPGGQARFFTAFAEKLLKHTRGVLYLVMEEAHEFAPKERSGVGDENMSVYYAKKIATAGRSKGLRLIACSQRVQALHNAVLGSCETVVVHKMTAPADQEPVIKWLRGNVQDKIQRAAIEQSLPKLKAGEGWICSGEMAEPQRIQFPRIATFDNSATPESDAAALHVVTAPVDHDKLRALIGEAVQQAEANDPVLLKRRIAELERQLNAQGTHTAADIVEARQTGERSGYERGRDAWYQTSAPLIRDQLLAAFGSVIGVVERHRADFIATFDRTAAAVAKSGATPSISPVKTPVITGKQPHNKGITTAKESHSYAAEGNGSLPPVQQRILNALAELEQLGSTSPEREIVAFLAGYANTTSTGFAKAISSLSSGGLVAYPTSGLVSLTREGAARARAPQSPQNAKEIQDRVIGLLEPVCGRILRPLIAAYPGALNRADAATKAGYSNTTSTGFAKALSRLSSLGFVRYPRPGLVAAAPVLFLEGA